MSIVPKRVPEETPEALAARLAEERAALDLAAQDFAAGRVVNISQVRAWVDALKRGEDVPVPQSGK